MGKRNKNVIKCKCKCTKCDMIKIDKEMVNLTNCFMMHTKILNILHVKVIAS